MKSFFVIIVAMSIFIGISALATVLGLITIPWLKLNRQIETNRGIVEQTYNADNALYNYHWFKERYEEIKATENKIENTQDQIDTFKEDAGDRSTWTFEDKQEYSRLNSILGGQQSYYETIVGEYNARAKEVDRAVFRDELPLFFNIKPY